MVYAPTEITEQLYVGANPPHDWLMSRGRKFALIVFCAEELPPPRGARYRHVPLYDDAQLAGNRKMLADAEAAARAIIRARGPSLCVCAAGRNRSAFVAALALVMAGVVPHAAVGLVRRKRELDCDCTVLFNPTFVATLHAWPKTRGPQP